MLFSLPEKGLIHSKCARNIKRKDGSGGGEEGLRKNVRKPGGHHSEKARVQKGVSLPMWVSSLVASESIFRGTVRPPC